MPLILFHTTATFLLTVVLISVLRKVSPRLGLIELANGRKQHTGAIPLVGGIAIFSAFALTLLAREDLGLVTLQFWIGLAITIVVGTTDDRFPLPAATRLVIQLGVAALLISDIDLSAIAARMPSSPALLSTVPLLFPIFGLFVAGLINSWNMLDGVDGLAGGAAAVALVWLMIIASFAGNSGIIAPMEIVLVGLCAFLLFNMRSPWRIRASVFLGDAGSMALGMTLAYFMLRIVTTSTVSFPALLWIVIVPITDTLSLMVRRTLAGRSPMSADRWHLHHLLIDGGLGKAEATNAILGASILCGAVGFGLIYMQASYPVTLCSLLLPISIHVAFVMTTGTYDLKRMTTFLPPEITPIPLEQPDMTETIIQPASQTVSELEL